MTNQPTNLKTSACAALWGVSERQARNLFAQLEAVGFQLEVDYHGGRLLPLAVATAAKSVRQVGLELASLRDRNDLKQHLRPDAAPADDKLPDLIELRTDVSILREIVGALHKSLSSGSTRLGYVAPTDWGFLAVPDPKRGL